MSPKRNEFATALNDYLRMSGQTPTWLATKIGRNPSVVSRWLSGETWPNDPTAVKKISEALALGDMSLQTKILAELINIRFEFILSDTSQHSGSVTTPSQSSASSPDSVFMVPALPPQGVWGREGLLSQISDMLELSSNESSIQPLALRGMGGIGKTTLAKTIGHQSNASQFFPDGVLWAELGPTPEIRVTLEAWGAAIGIDLLPQRHEEACKAVLQSALRKQSVLLIVDDIWDSNHAEFFNIGGPQSRTLFTTREPHIAHKLATRERTLRVDVLTEEASLLLLKSLAPEVVNADRENALRLCDRLEYLPLGLTLAGRLLANEMDVPSRLNRLLHELLERRRGEGSPLSLVQSEGRKGIDADQPASIRAILGLSVERLDELDRNRFAEASVFGGAPLYWDLPAAAGIWQCSQLEAENSISNLVKRGLLEHETSTGRYWMHALLADYASELLNQFQI